LVEAVIVGEAEAGYKCRDVPEVAGVCPFVDALDDFLLPKPKILKPLPPATACAAAVVLPEDAATTSGLDPFLAAKSWKLIGGAEALRGLLE